MNKYDSVSVTLCVCVLGVCTTESMIHVGLTTVPTTGGALANTRTKQMITREGLWRFRLWSHVYVTCRWIECHHPKVEVLPGRTKRRASTAQQVSHAAAWRWQGRQKT